MSDLIVIEKLDPNEIFNDEEATKIIKQITDKVNEFTPDISTAKGRKEISTVAAKVAKSKVLIDNMGKDLVSDRKAKLKKVDIVRKKIRDELDELKLTYRAPLTEWEENDKARIAEHEKNIGFMVNTGESSRDGWMNLPAQLLKDNLLVITEKVIDDSWDEFEHDATVAKFEAISLIEKALERRTEQDNKDAELEKYRKQAEEDDRARFEANAKLEAEQAERERTIKQNDQLKADKELAEKNEKLAIERAEAAKKDAEDKAFKELEEKQAKEQAETAAREADTKHRGKINREAVKALAALGLSDADAKTAVKAIASRMVPNVTINY